MTIKELQRITKSESSASHYLLSRCSDISPFHCPSCGFEKLYLIEGGKRRRCARCGHSFNPFAGRWLDEAKIGCRAWLWVVKLFELKTTATKTSRETSLSYPTVLRTLEIIRKAIAGVVEGMPSSCYSGSAEPRSDSASEQASAGDSVEKSSILLSMRVADGCIVIADRALDLDVLLCCNKKLELVDRGKFFPKLRVYCNVKGFWAYAKENLAKYHGVSRDKLPLYIAEMIFRWENRETDLFELIVDRLCSYVHESKNTTPVREAPVK